MSQDKPTSVAPQPIRTGRNNTVLRCSYTCPFYCRTYVNFESHLENRHFCNDCALYFNNRDSHDCQSRGEARGNVDHGSDLDLSFFDEYSRSHGGSMISYKYKKPLNTPDIETTFTEVEEATKKLLGQLYKIHSLSKIEISIGVLMEKEILKEDGSKGYKQGLIYFKSGHYELQTPASIDYIILNSASDIINKKNTFTENGSGWYVLQVQSFEVKLGEIRLFLNSKASSYLPMPFKSRQGYVNFKNRDMFCFKYCLAAGLFWNEQIELNRKTGKSNKNLYSYKTWKNYLHRLNFGNINGEMNIYTDLPKFEEDNDVSVNVLSHRNGQVVLVRSSKVKASRVVTIFLIHTSVGCRDLYHFALVTNLDKFLNHKKPVKAYFCQRCLRYFTSGKKCSSHLKYCMTEEGIPTKMPKDGEVLEFKRPEMTLPYPYILYWDFECFATDVEDKSMFGNSTTVEKKFLPASYSLCVVNSTGSEQHIIAQEYYDGPKPVDHFFERVFKIAEDLLFSIRTTNNFVVPTPEELKKHEATTHCEFCLRKFTTPEEEEERDVAFEAAKIQTNHKKTIIRKCYHHCHQSGKYLKTICSGCNLKIKFKHELVCIAHNSAGFDMHLLMKHLENPIFDVKDISVISKGTEKFVQLEIPAKDRLVPSLNYKYNSGHSPTKGWNGNRKVKVRFIDSCQFLPNKLSTLAQALKKEGANTLNLVTESIPFILGHNYAAGNAKRAKKNNLLAEDVSILFEKLPYPYNYLSSRDVLEEGHPIPSRDRFYNDLEREECTDEDWDKVTRVCNAFDINDFRQFTRLYNVLDTVLLAVIWENFRRNGLDMYGLDPTYLCTGSGYTWQCFLYKTKAKVEYVRDRQMVNWLSRAVRGGTSFCTRKVQTANNERCPRGYDPSKERTHIIYNDKVSLYATALLDKYPQSEYKWENVEDLEAIDWTTYNGENDKGYFLEVSLSYPPDVQDKTVDLPLAPERRIIKFEELGKQQQNTMKKLGKGITNAFTTTPRLLLHCHDRRNYILHYKALKYYLGMGLKIQKIHKGMSFKETSYFRDYIQFNIDKRKVAKSESMRQFLKNQNNQIFGKCLESYKNNVRIKFCDSRAKSRHLLSKPECKDFIPISEHISVVMLSPKYVTLNKPVQSGVTVLDLAKVIFYTGYYQELKKIFEDRIYNLYMDTDSSISIVSDPQNTFYDDLIKHREYFDFSKIPAEHEFFSHASIPDLRMFNAGVSGKWKIESFDIQEIVTLKPKQYSILYFDNTEDLKCKGMSSSSLKTFSHSQYAEVALKNKVVNLDMKYIRCVNHTLYNITVNKIAFHSLDVYRVYCNPLDKNFSLPLGHYRLKNYVN